MHPSEGTVRAAGPDRSQLIRALRLLVLTDPQCRHPGGVLAAVRVTLDAGVGSIQLRDKGASAGELLTLAESLRALTREFGALLFVNDRLDVALASEADGVHLGPDDLPVDRVRKRVPPGFLIGVSADDPERALGLVEAGADYVGCGTVFQTSSKADAGEQIGLDGLRRMVRSVPVPVVGIGGITPARYPEVLGTGAVGAAVLGAVMSVPDAGAAVRAFLDASPESASGG